MAIQGKLLLSKIALEAFKYFYKIGFYTK